MIPLVVANEPGRAQILNLVACNGCSNCSFVKRIREACARKSLMEISVREGENPVRPWYSVEHMFSF